MSAEQCWNELLAKHLRRWEMSRGELAWRVHVDPSYISRLVRQERDPPRRDIVQRIATALHLSGDDELQFYLMAGYATPAQMRRGERNNDLERLACVMDRLSDEEAAPVRRIIRDLCVLCDVE